MIIRPIIKRKVAFQRLACSVMDIAARSAPEITPNSSEVRRTLQAQSQDSPSKIHSAEQVVLQVPDVRSIIDKGGLSSSLTFWRSLVYRSEDVNSEQKAQVPSRLLEFYNECPPLTMQQKSFLFTCAFGRRDGRPPAPREFLCPRLMDHLSACHLLELLDAQKLNVNEPHLLRCIDREDRLQYLHESEHHAAVEQLERSRWLYLDAGNEATFLSLQQLQTTILVDMSMLLLWHRSSRTSEQKSIATFVICLAMMFIAMEGSGDCDIRMAYYFIQQAYQSVRCGYLTSPSKHISAAGIASALLEECAASIQRGWSLFTKAWKPQSLPLPSGSRFFCKHELLKSGLWPILLNPFKLSGRKWADVEDQSPFKGLKAHSALKEAVFTLDPKMFGSNINTEEAAAPYEDRIAALKTFIAQEYDRPPSMPTSVPLLYRTPYDGALSDDDAMMRLSIPSSWILRRPRSLLGGVQWMDEDPEKVVVRVKLSLSHCAGLVLGDQQPWAVHWTALNKQLSYAHRQLQTTLAALIRFCPGCCCHLAPPSKECRLDMLDLLSRFTVMVPKFQVAACLVDMNVGFSEYSEAGYSEEELEFANRPPHSAVLWQFEESSSPPESSSKARLRRVLLCRQAKAGVPRSGGCAPKAKGAPDAEARAPKAKKGSQPQCSAASKVNRRKEAPVKKRQGHKSVESPAESFTVASLTVESESTAESLESRTPTSCQTLPMSACASRRSCSAFNLGEISTALSATCQPFAAYRL